MNKKKIMPVGIFAIVIVIGAGVAYYCFPSAINNALGINGAGVDAVSDNNLLATDGASSSVLMDDDDTATNVGATDDSAPAVPQTPVAAPVKKITPKEQSAATQTPVASSTPIQPGGGTPGTGSATGSAVTAATSTVPISVPTPVQVQTSTVEPTPVSLPQDVASVQNVPEEVSTSPDTNVAASTSVTTADMQSITSTESDSNVSANATASIVSAVLDISAVNHVLIAAVQIAGASSSNDLVKLFNPTAAAIDMSGWKLHKKSSTGTDYSLKTFPTGSVIGVGQSFVWANSDDGFSDSVGANVSSTETLAADNSVALMDAAGTIVDAVSWGTGTNQYSEGPPYPTNPGANQLLSRRSSDGVMTDTDDNSNDFTIQ